MLVKYCSAECQRNHWPKHKKDCKLRAAKLRDEALFKDPPAKEDCPICFLPMPNKLICCVLLPPATISSVPIDDYAVAHEELAGEELVIHVAVKTFAAGAFTPSVNLVTLASVRFAIPAEVAKQMKKELKN
jgi:hypothetical protein